jgi:hypothetical protein
MGGIAKAVSSVVSGVGKAVSSVASSVGSAVSSTASGVDACGRKTINNLENAVSNVIKNPLPIIETIALTAVLGPAGAGFSGVAAASISSAAVSAANGGNIGDIATAAATSYAGGVAGQAAGTAVGAEIGSESSGAQLTTLGKITSSAVGASTTTTLRQLADGSSLSDAVSAGSKSFAAAGITTGAIEGLKAAFNESPSYPAPVEERGTIEATGEAVAAEPPPLGIQQQYATLRVDSPYTPSDPLIGKTESQLLASALYPAVYSTLFGKQQQAPVSAPRGTTAAPKQAAAPTQPISPVQTTAGPGTQALSQALRVGDAGAPVFGGDKEEGKKAGWNVESLRYMGNSEA